MSSTAPLTERPVDAMYHAAALAVAPDAGFETRWTTWVSRGRIHEQRVRRRLGVWGPVIAIGAALIYASFQS
jgi:hypothetical protein